MSETVAADLRLHPATLAIRALERLPEFVLGLPAAAYFIGDVGIGAVLAIAVVGLIGSFGYALLYWSRFSYGLGEQQLVIESGILSRNRRTIPFDRIQDVSLEQKLLARIFGVSIVRIETGSSGNDEGKLDCVSRAEADRLRDVIRRYRAEAAGGAAQPPEAGEARAEAPALFAMNIGRVLLAGLFNFSLVFLAIIGAAWQYLGNYVPVRYLDPELWIEDERVGPIGSLSLAAALALLLVLVLIGMITGVARTLARDYGFRLTRTESGLRRLRGLFTHTDVVIPLRRIQAAIISTGIVRRHFGWHELALQSLGSDGSDGTHHVAAAFARAGEIGPILDEIDLPLPPGADAFERVSPRSMWRSRIEAGAVLAVAIPVAGYIWPFGWLLLALVPLLAIVPVLQFRAHGHCEQGGVIFVRHGVRRPKIVILPRAKIQSLTLRRNLLQRALGLASLIVGTAGGSRASPLKIDDLDNDIAHRLLVDWSNG